MIQIIGIEDAVKIMKYAKERVTKEFGPNRCEKCSIKNTWCKIDDIYEGLRRGTADSNNEVEHLLADYPVLEDEIRRLLDNNE